MSFIPDLSFTKTDVPLRTETGCRSIAFPSTGLDETKQILPGCKGCPKAAAHCPASNILVQIPFGETRYQRVPEDNRPLVEDVWKLQTAFHLLGYAAHGYIDDRYIYNAGLGTANNASQTVQYEIVGCGTNTLTLYGRNPKNITVGTSIINPDYPFAAPNELRPTGISDEAWDIQKYGRLISGNKNQVLPVGSAVEYLNNVLANISYPLIKKVNAPVSNDETVTFTVEVDQNCSKACTPYDAYFVPQKYFCRVRFEALSPANYLNVQKPAETSFTKAKVEISAATTHTFLNSEIKLPYPV